jgi:hypothetical protein
MRSSSEREPGSSAIAGIRSRSFTRVGDESARKPTGSVAAFGARSRPAGIERAAGRASRSRGSPRTRLTTARSLSRRRGAGATRDRCSRCCATRSTAGTRWRLTRSPRGTSTESAFGRTSASGRSSRRKRHALESRKRTSTLRTRSRAARACPRTRGERTSITGERPPSATLRRCTRSGAVSAGASERDETIAEGSSGSTKRSA